MIPQDLNCRKLKVLAKETGAIVYASNLWISADENKARFAEWGVENRIVSFCENAGDLNFEKNLFRAWVSTDAYHYFGTKKEFFTEKILPLLKDNATVLIGVPGIKDVYAAHADVLLTEWLGIESSMFRSPTAWKEIIGNSDRIALVETWEMECFDKAWSEWLHTGNGYALDDKKFYETHIKPYSCLVGICIKIK